MVKTMANRKFKKCPRCELNYIEESEEFCKVCKAQMGLIDGSHLITDDEEEGVDKLCPICKTNYISNDEDMCIDCRREKERKEEAEVNEENDDWREYVEDETADEPDGEISLDEFEEDEEEQQEENERYAEPDDFNYEVNPDDFETDDEEEEEDEDGDDEF